MLNKVLTVLGLVLVSSLFFYLGQGYKEVSTVTNIPFANDDVRQVMNGELKSCSREWGKCSVTVMEVGGYQYFIVFPETEK